MLKCIGLADISGDANPSAGSFVLVDADVVSNPHRDNHRIPNHENGKQSKRLLEIGRPGCPVDANPEVDEIDPEQCQQQRCSPTVFLSGQLLVLLTDVPQHSRSCSWVITTASVIREFLDRIEKTGKDSTPIGAGGPMWKTG